jgi:hypothetical protein
MAAPTYSVTLHHLAPGATAAGLQFPDEQLPSVTPAQLRDLLNGLSVVAMGLTIYEPSSPEIRIKTDRDVFVVRTRYRQLCFVGWETTLRGEEHTAAYILSTISGGTAEVTRLATARLERPASATPTASGDTKGAASARSRRLKLTIMAVLVLGFNGATAWMLLKPAPGVLPTYELLTETESHALLIKAAGEYQTGTGEGDRCLTVNQDGNLRFAKYGRGRAVVEPRDRPASGASMAGKPVLVTTDKNPVLLEIKDVDTLIYSKTVYHRIGH